MNNREFESFNDIMNKMKLTILEHGWLDAAEDWQFFDLSSPFNRIYFVLEGSGGIFNETNGVTIDDGHVYLVPLGQSFNYVCDDHLKMFYVHFRLELLAGIDLFEGFTRCERQAIDKGIIHELVRRAEKSGISDIMFCKSVLYDRISTFAEPLSETVTDQVKMKGKYAEVYDYVKNHCFADLKIKDIAGYLDMNPSTLSKGFRSNTGMTLKSYIDSKLIQATQEYLLVSDATVKEIAYELRFSDEFQFSRFFKKHVGISPSTYRLRKNSLK